MDDNNEPSEDPKKGDSSNPSRLGLSLTLSSKAPIAENDSVEIEDSGERCLGNSGSDAPDAYVHVTSSDEEEASEVGSFMMTSDLDEGGIDDLDEPDLEIPVVETNNSVDPDTQARLDALLEAAGIKRSADGQGKTLSDPDVLRKLTTSVSSALDRAASALNRMKGDSNDDEDIAEVQRVLGAGQGVDPNEDGESLLSLACSAGYFELAQVLLAMHANVEDRGIKGDCTPLMEAANGGFADIVKLLIHNGANVNAQSSAGNTALHYAANRGHDEVVQSLVKNSANVEEHNENGHTPLMEAASEGYVSVARILLEAGAGINTHSNEFKESALTLACYKGHLDMVKFLLESGADHEHKTDEMHTALMEAAMDGHVEVAKLLLDNGAQVNMPMESFESPLTLAACGGHVDLARLLIRRGADLEEGNDEGYTPLMEASREGHEDMVQLLLTAGAVVNQQTEETQETALTLACCGGFIDVARLLIGAGADLEMGCSSPLMEASQEGHLDLVQFLLEQGAGVMTQTGTGDTALTWACENGHNDVAELLLQHGAILEHQSEGGRTPLMKAVIAGHEPTVKFLLSKGAQVNKCTMTNDHTVLSLACSGGHYSIVELLLQSGADPTHKLADGSTMLIEAAKGGHSDIVTLLLEWPDRLSTVAAYLQPDLSNYTAEQLRQLNAFIPLVSAQQPVLAGSDVGQLSSKMPLDIQAALEQSTARLFQARGAVVEAENSRNDNATAEQLEKKQQLLKQLHTLEREVQEQVMQQLAPKKQTNRQRPIALPPPPMNEAADDKESNSLAQASQLLPPAVPLAASLPNGTGLRPLHETYRDHCNPTPAAGPRQEVPEKAVIRAKPEPSREESEANQPQAPLPLHLAFKDQLENQMEAQKKAAAEGRSPTSVEVELDDDTYQRQVMSNRGRNLSSGASPAPSSSVAANATAQTAKKQEASSSNGLKSGNTSTEKNAYFTSHSEAAPETNGQATPTADEQPPPSPAYSVRKSTRECLSKTSRDALTTTLQQQQQALLQSLTPQQQQQLLQAQPQPLAAQQVSLSAAQLQQLSHQQQQQLQILQLQMLQQQQAAVAAQQEQTQLQTKLKSAKQTQKPQPYPPQQNAQQARLPPDGASSTSLLSPQPPLDPSLYLQPSTGAAALRQDRYVDVELDAQTESNHDTALTLACVGGHSELVRLLVEKGADIEHRDKKGFTPLILAATAGHTEVVQILLENNADIEAQSERTKDTPLSLACSGGKHDVVELLLKKGAKKEHRNVSDYTPLSLAASGGYVNIIKLLLSHGAEINSRTGSKLGISPLMLAAMNGHTPAVKYLLDMGSDINAQIETNKNTALTLACFQGRHEVVSLLVERKANIEHRAKTGLTPLMEAASGGYVEVGRALLDKGADVNATPVPSSKDTALTIAADKGHFHFCKLLINASAVVDVKNKKGNSPLWLACNGGHQDVVQLLVSSHADIHSSDNRGVTCLVAAFKKGHVKVVKWLVKHVTQFPSDQECNKLATQTDKELSKKCDQCREVIMAAKERQTTEADNNANSLLAEIDKEKELEEQKKQQREKRKAKKKEKRKKDRQQKNSQESEPMESCTKPTDTSGAAGASNAVVEPEVKPETSKPPQARPSPLPNTDKRSNTTQPSDQSQPVVHQTEQRTATPEEGMQGLSKRQKKNRRNKQKAEQAERTVPEKPVSKPSTSPVSLSIPELMMAPVPVTSVVAPPVSSRSLPLTAVWGSVGGVTPFSSADVSHGGSSTTSPVKSNRKQRNQLTPLSPDCISPKGSKPTAVVSPRKARKAEGWKTVSKKVNKISVDSSIIQKVVGGRNHSNLIAIRNYSGANIELDKPSRSSNERLIQIKGSSESTQLAAQCIQALIKQPDKTLESLVPGIKRKRLLQTNIQPPPDLDTTITATASGLPSTSQGEVSNSPKQQSPRQRRPAAPTSATKPQRAATLFSAVAAGASKPRSADDASSRVFGPFDNSFTGQVVKDEERKDFASVAAGRLPPTSNLSGLSPGLTALQPDLTPASTSTGLTPAGLNPVGMPCGPYQPPADLPPSRQTNRQDEQDQVKAPGYKGPALAAAISPPLNLPSAHVADPVVTSDTDTSEPEVYSNPLGPIGGPDPSRTVGYRGEPKAGGEVRRTVTDPMAIPDPLRDLKDLKSDEQAEESGRQRHVYGDPYQQQQMAVGGTSTFTSLFPTMHTRPQQPLSTVTPPLQNTRFPDALHSRFVRPYSSTGQASSQSSVTQLPSSLSQLTSSMSQLSTSSAELRADRLSNQVSASTVTTSSLPAPIGVGAIGSSRASSNLAPGAPPVVYTPGAVGSNLGAGAIGSLGPPMGSSPAPGAVGSGLAPVGNTMTPVGNKYSGRDVSAEGDGMYTRSWNETADQGWSTATNIRQQTGMSSALGNGWFDQTPSTSAMSSLPAGPFAPLAPGSLPPPGSLPLAPGANLSGFSPAVGSGSTNSRLAGLTNGQPPLGSGLPSGLGMGGSSLPPGLGGTSSAGSYGSQSASFSQLVDSNPVSFSAQQLLDPSSVRGGGSRGQHSYNVVGGGTNSDSAQYNSMAYGSQQSFPSQQGYNVIGSRLATDRNPLHNSGLHASAMSNAGLHGSDRLQANPSAFDRLQGSSLLTSLDKAPGSNIGYTDLSAGMMKSLTPGSSLPPTGSMPPRANSLQPSALPPSMNLPSAGLHHSGGLQPSASLQHSGLQPPGLQPSGLQPGLGDLLVAGGSQFNSAVSNVWPESEVTETGSRLWSHWSDGGR